MCCIWNKKITKDINRNFTGKRYTISLKCHENILTLPHTFETAHKNESEIQFFTYHVFKNLKFCLSKQSYRLLEGASIWFDSQGGKFGNIFESCKFIYLRPLS